MCLRMTPVGLLGRCRRAGDVSPSRRPVSNPCFGAQGLSVSWVRSDGEVRRAQLHARVDEHVSTAWFVRHCSGLPNSPVCEPDTLTTRRPPCKMTRVEMRRISCAPPSVSRSVDRRTDSTVSYTRLGSTRGSSDGERYTNPVSSRLAFDGDCRGSRLGRLRRHGQHIGRPIESSPVVQTESREKHADHTYGFTVKYYPREYVFLNEDPIQTTIQPKVVYRVRFQRKDIAAGQVAEHEPSGLTVSVFELSPGLPLHDWLDSSGLLSPGSETFSSD